MSAPPNKPRMSPAPTLGPGAQLAQARLDLHWSPEDVATRLHLSARQILALEADDYSSLPGATYVRGYLKSYALLLGLSPEPVLAAHARLTAKPAQQDFSAIAPQKEITSRHHQIRFTTYLVAAIVIGLAIAWWAGRDTQVPATVATSGNVPPATTIPSTGTESAVSPAPAEAPATGPALATGSAPAHVAPELSTPTAGHAAVVAPSPSPAQIPAPVATTAPATVAPSAPAAPVAPSLPAGPRGKLVLTAEQDTWVDIRDARQVKLLYETVPAGRVVQLEGVTPFSVFLGNAAGARIEFNGKAVDVARHQRGMVARFTLGEPDSDAAPGR